MPPSAQAHSRSHSILLLQKLLNLRDSTASPLTLVLDSIEQPATPLLGEFSRRAKVTGSKVVLLSFATVRRPAHVDALVVGRGKSLQSLRDELVKLYPAEGSQRVLVLIDTLNPLASSSPSLLPAFLSGILGPTTSVVAVYNSDVPLVSSPSSSRAESHNHPYAPHPLSVLTHLATAIFRLSSLYHEIERQRARNRSIQEPEFGLREGREGVIAGLKTSGRWGKSFVLEMEMRRRSGRAVVDQFAVSPGTGKGKGGFAGLVLLREHEEFRVPEDVGGEGVIGSGGGGGEGDEEPESTFNLGLTEKQRRDREGVVLPYFDAQIDVGGGEGGRILYDMGREDDFDEEEDEI